MSHLKGVKNTEQLNETFDTILVHYEMVSFKKFVMLDFPTLKSLLFSFFVKYDVEKMNEVFISFLCYDGFPVDDSIFFCQLKLIIILCQTKKGGKEETLWSLPLHAGYFLGPIMMTWQHSRKPG